MNILGIKISIDTTEAQERAWERKIERLATRDIRHQMQKIEVERRKAELLDAVDRRKAELAAQLPPIAETVRQEIDNEERIGRGYKSPVAQRPADDAQATVKARHAGYMEAKAAEEKHKAPRVDNSPSIADHAFAARTRG